MCFSRKTRSCLLASQPRRRLFVPSGQARGGVTSRAMAQMNPANSLAIAMTAMTGSLFAFVDKYRYRLHRRFCAFQAIAWTPSGAFSARRWR